MFICQSVSSPHIRSIRLFSLAQVCYQTISTAASYLQLSHHLVSPDQLFSGANYFKKFQQFTVSKMFSDWTRVDSLRELKAATLAGLPLNEVFQVQKKVSSVLDNLPKQVGKDVVCDLPKALRELAAAKNLPSPSKIVTVLRKLTPTDILAEVVDANKKVLAASRAQTETKARKEALENFEFLLNSM